MRIPFPSRDLHPNTYKAGAQADHHLILDMIAQPVVNPHLLYFNGIHHCYSAHASSRSSFKNCSEKRFFSHARSLPSYLASSTLPPITVAKRKRPRPATAYEVILIFPGCLRTPTSVHKEQGWSSGPHIP